MRGGDDLPSFSRFFLSVIQGYNHNKYWARRSKLIDPNNHTPLIIKLWWLLYIKRTDARMHCSFGTGLNYGAFFATPPHLPHGPQGIIVGYDVKVGKDCVILHQVTIAAGHVVIGDDCFLGAGSKVLPNVSIGDHCKIGANAVVVGNLPDNTTCVLQKPRIIRNNV